MLEIMVPAWSGSDERRLSGCRLLTSHCILLWQEELASSLASSLKDINFTYEGFTLTILSLPIGLTSKYHYIGLRCQHIILVTVHKHSVHNATSLQVCICRIYQDFFCMGNFHNIFNPPA